MLVAQAVGLLQVAWGSWAVAWVVVVGLLQVAQAAVAVGLLLQLLLLLLLLLLLAAAVGCCCCWLLLVAAPNHQNLQNGVVAWMVVAQAVGLLQVMQVAQQLLLQVAQVAQAAVAAAAATPAVGCPDFCSAACYKAACSPATCDMPDLGSTSGLSANCSSSPPSCHTWCTSPAASSRPSRMRTVAGSVPCCHCCRFCWLLLLAQVAVAVGLRLQLLLQVAQVAQAAVAAAAATPAPSSKCGALRPESLRRALARCAPMALVLANTI